MANIAKLLTEHIDIWTAADTEKKSGRGRTSGNAGSVYGVKKLRELILELAVRGKLVPQDASDEPVSELIKRIQAEKTKQIAEGKLKKEKPLAPIGEDEKPFEQPKGWEWVRFQDVSIYIQRGKGPEYVDASPFLVVSQKCVRWGGIDLNVARHISPESLIKYEEIRFLKNSDLLWNSTGTGTIGRACLYQNSDMQQKSVADSHVTIVRTLFGIDQFLFRYIQSPIVQNKIEAMASGTTNQIELNTSTVIAHLLPLPPLAEQHRIVAKVDELMVLCDQLEQQHSNAQAAHETLVIQLLSTLTQSQNAAEFNANWQRIYAHFDVLFTTEASIDALKQTLLQLAVMGKLVPQDPNDEPASELLKRIQAEKVKLITEGKLKKEKSLAPIAEDEKPFELPKGWEWVKLEQIAKVGTGATPLRSKPEYFNPAEISWVTSGETSNSFIFETEQFVSKLALKETNLTVYPIGTLIVAMYGQGKTRGQISELMIDACTNQACAGIQLFEREPSHRKYVKLFFEKIYDEIRELSVGGAQPNLNLSKVKETSVLLPPINEQRRIVVKVDALMALCDQLKASMQKANQQQQAIANALVAQALQPASAEVINLADYRAAVACHIINKNQGKPYFGRTAAMKLLYLAQAHIGLELNLQPEREAAGPLDKWIYEFERQGKQSQWFSVNEKQILNGKTKTEYQVKTGIAEPIKLIEQICTDQQRKELDRMFNLFADKNTEEAEIIATLFAAWNDFLIDGNAPTDDQIVKEVRENWHESKARFTSATLNKWLVWLRTYQLVPKGREPRTKYQQSLIN